MSSKYTKCMFTSPSSDLAIAGPAGVMLPSKCHIGICAKQWIPGPYSTLEGSAHSAYKGLSTRLDQWSALKYC